MSFHENLILQVYNYKELYDLSDRHYSNHQRKEEIWREIAEQIGEKSKYNNNLFVVLTKILYALFMYKHFSHNIASSTSDFL